MTDRARVLGSAAVFTSLCCVLGGCGSASDSGNETAGGSPDTAAAAPGELGSATAIDACSLLSAGDISGVLGVPVKGTSTGTDPEMPGCSWENPESYESVTVEIGNPGTAVNNTLPPPEPGDLEVGTPGPDGMRFLSSGLVEFAAGGRINTVQVAVLGASPAHVNSAAVELARKVGPRLLT